MAVELLVLNFFKNSFKVPRSIQQYHLPRTSLTSFHLLCQNGLKSIYSRNSCFFAQTRSQRWTLHHEEPSFPKLHKATESMQIQPGPQWVCSHLTHTCSHVGIFDSVRIERKQKPGNTRQLEPYLHRWNKSVIETWCTILAKPWYTMVWPQKQSPRSNTVHLSTGSFPFAKRLS